MDLDARQSRGLFLSGKVSFPAPYPSTGTIALDVGQLTYSRGQAPHRKDLVQVLEFCENQTVVRTMLQTDVAAIFIPCIKVDNGPFQISQDAQVSDFELGEWFLEDDVNAATIRQRLNLGQQDDISTRNSILRGIVFMAEDRPILRTTEVFYTAGADDELLRICCTCKYDYDSFPTRRYDEGFLEAACTRCMSAE